MSNEAIDLARQKKIPFRTNRGQRIDRTIIVKNEDGGNYDFSEHTAEMYVYNSFSKTTTPEYTITVTLSSGEMRFTHDAINILREELVYQLWITDASAYRQVWLNGPFLILNREWNYEDTEDTIFISPDGDEITLNVSAGYSPLLKSIEAELTSSEILNLHTTPIQLLGPPGADKYILPIVIDFNYFFGDTPYTRLSSAQIISSWDGVTAATSGVGDMLTQTFNCGQNGGGGMPLTNHNLILNKGLFLSITAGSFTLGNGTLKTKVLYHVVTV